ncbi:MAG: hypothetical protein MZV64_37695 [Ignavibacteriales bacterium]|nr:hypothetical protein [Ignavibacteriales bacterium]
MVSNSGYSDVRGIETKLDSRFNGMFNFGLSHEIYWSFNGEVGFSRLYETGSQSVNVPKGLRQERGLGEIISVSRDGQVLQSIKMRDLRSAGFKPLSDFNVYLNFWWRSGDPYTYHASRRYFYRTK